MANNMQSFDFGALDSTALDETLSFLDNYDPIPLPEPSFAGFEGFGQPMMDWPVGENHVWHPLSNADFSGGVTNALTDNSIPGFHAPNPGTELEGQPHQPCHIAGAETPLDFGESSTTLPTTGPSMGPIISPGCPMSCLPHGDLSPVRELFLQGAEQDVSFPTEHSPSMDKTPLSCFACHWPSCKSIITYGTLRDLQNHQNDVHVADVMRDWPGSCSWPGCNSKIFFKTSKRLESHVYNIHLTPLRCTTKGCDHNRPFERQADLERHVISRHSMTRKYKCPHPKCFRSPRFSRKDKLKCHERTYHGQFACQHNHCIYGFSTEGKIQKHVVTYWSHEIFECGLASCGRTSTSHFTTIHLRLHLVHDHLISSEVAWQAITKKGYAVDTLTLAHFPDGFTAFQDCKGCIEKLKEAASRKEGGEEK